MKYFKIILILTLGFVLSTCTKEKYAISESNVLKNQKKLKMAFNLNAHLTNSNQNIFKDSISLLNYVNKFDDKISFSGSFKNGYLFIASNNEIFMNLEFRPSDANGFSQLKSFSNRKSKHKTLRQKSIQNLPPVCDNAYSPNLALKNDKILFWSPYYTEENWKSIEEPMLNQLIADFPTLDINILTDENANILSLERHLNNYGIIVLSSHGGANSISTNIELSEEFKAVFENAPIEEEIDWSIHDISVEELYIYGLYQDGEISPTSEKVSGSSIKRSLSFTLKPDFFKRFNLLNSFLIFDLCSGFEEVGFFNVMKAKGAAGLFGYNDVVATVCSVPFTEHILTSLLQGCEIVNSISEYASEYELCASNFEEGTEFDFANFKDDVGLNKYVFKNCPITITAQTGLDDEIYTTDQFGATCWMTESLKLGEGNPDGLGYPASILLDYYPESFGRLYTQTDLIEIQKQSGNNNSPCPNGWRLPTESDLKYIVSLVDGSSIKLQELYNFNYDYTGYLYPQKDLLDFGLSTGYWSSTQAVDGTYYYLDINEEEVNVRTSVPSVGFPCRCVKD